MLDHQRALGGILGWRLGVVWGKPGTKYGSSTEAVLIGLPSGASPPVAKFCGLPRTCAHAWRLRGAATVPSSSCVLRRASRRRYCAFRTYHRRQAPGMRTSAPSTTRRRRCQSPCAGGWSYCIQLYCLRQSACHPRLRRGNTGRFRCVKRPCALNGCPTHRHRRTSSQITQQTAPSLWRRL